MKLLFTPTAREQFLAGLVYIKRDKPEAAVAFRKKAETALKRLLKYPKLGRLLPEFSDLPHREVVVPPYRFFYLVRGETIWVVAVWHSAQLPSEP